MDKKAENYLKKIPIFTPDLIWTKDDGGLVTIYMENRGIMNRLAQKLLGKPKISQIHLDELGSFVWLLVDGKRSLMDMGPLVQEQFGDSSQPVYERLAEFFRMLEKYGWIGDHPSTF